jgi:acyl-CoA thioester hydrolase
MAKPDPALLDPARYPFRCAIEPRFGDLDINMHLNNVALAEILQEGRVRFHHASSYSAAIAGMSSMAVSFSVDYLGQALYPEPLDMHVAATGLGRTSHSLGQLVRQGGRTIAVARTVLVCVRDSQPVEIPASFRAAIEPWMLEP